MDFQNTEAKDKAFAVLIPIDHKLHCHAQHVHHMLKKLSMMHAHEEIQANLEDQLKWLEEHLNIFTQLNSRQDEANELLCQEVGQNIGQVLIAMEGIVKVITDRIVEDNSLRETASSIVETSEALSRN